MRIKPEQVALAICAPVMIGGLFAAALASGWTMRVGGGAMVLGASLVLAVTDRRGRAVAWTLAALGGLVVMAGWL